MERSQVLLETSTKSVSLFVSLRTLKTGLSKMNYFRQEQIIQKHIKSIKDLEDHERG